MTHKNGRNFLTSGGALSSAHTASPRSGRHSLAQRETLGTRSELDPSAVGTAAVLNRRRIAGRGARPTFKAVVPTGLRILQRPVPSVSRWARLWRPLRGLGGWAWSHNVATPRLLHAVGTAAFINQTQIVDRRARRNSSTGREIHPRNCASDDVASDSRCNP